mmetsp:Transcript_119336/g.338386  ORF Transcript_119336/g.338386 Transcript_119336/m.338386 type:complete len:315 (-) Transcript_119336:781-1725(-)
MGCAPWVRVQGPQLPARDEEPGRTDWIFVTGAWRGRCECSCIGDWWRSSRCPTKPVPARGVCAPKLVQALMLLPAACCGESSVVHTCGVGMDLADVDNTNGGGAATCEGTADATGVRVAGQSITVALPMLPIWGSGRNFWSGETTARLTFGADLVIADGACNKVGCPTGPPISSCTSDPTGEAGADICCTEGGGRATKDLTRGVPAVLTGGGALPGITPEPVMNSAWSSLMGSRRSALAARRPVAISLRIGGALAKTSMSSVLRAVGIWWMGTSERPTMSATKRPVISSATMSPSDHASSPGCGPQPSMASGEA